MSDGCEVESLMKRFERSIRQVADDLKRDAARWGDSPGSLARGDDATAAIELLQGIQRAIDDAQMYVGSLPKRTTQKTALQEWLRRAADMLGGSLASAESLNARGKHDLAFRTARNAYSRLNGAWLTTKPVYTACRLNGTSKRGRPKCEDTAARRRDGAHLREAQGLSDKEIAERQDVTVETARMDRRLDSGWTPRPKEKAAGRGGINSQR